MSTMCCKTISTTSGNAEPQIILLALGQVMLSLVNVITVSEYTQMVDAGLQPTAATCPTSMLNLVHIGKASRSFQTGYIVFFKALTLDGCTMRVVVIIHKEKTHCTLDETNALLQNDILITQDCPPLSVTDNCS